MIKNITLILATDENDLMGKDNTLPWKLPEDLKYFKRMTLDKTLLMGRKTCESLPFPLPKRRNIVITRNKYFTKKGFEVIHNLSELPDLDELIVIGGSTIYTLLLPHSNTVLLTRVYGTHEGDTYFDTSFLESNQWVRDSVIYRQNCSFNTFKRAPIPNT